MLELSAHGGRSREKRLRGGGGRAHSFFLPPLRPLESFLFFPMAMRGKYAGGPSLAGTQVWAAPGPTTRTAPEDLEQKKQPRSSKIFGSRRRAAPYCATALQPPSCSRWYAPSRTPTRAIGFMRPRCRCDKCRVRPAAATQHAQPILLPAATRSCPPAVRGLALPSLTGLPPPRRSTSPSPSCRRSSPSRGTSARCPSSRTSTTASRR